MSFVSIIASSERVSAVSDCRLVDLTDEGTRQAVPGSKPGLVRISDCQLLACTGSATVLKRMKKEFPFRRQHYKMDQEMLDHLAQLASAVPFAHQDVLISLVSTAGSVSCRLFSNKPGDAWQTLIPEKGRLATLFLAGRDIDEQAIRTIYNEFARLLGLYGGEDDFRQIRRAQEELNHFASGIDPLIGERIAHMELIRKSV
ncbi:hypothetical protein EWH99_09080 [Sporolactobacillus sp. THM7-7]|nr:hypothetical protein EWH99_09080 [Sporolactobacillus sp. THM7-7]